MKMQSPLHPSLALSTFVLIEAAIHPATGCTDERGQGFVFAQDNSLSIIDDIHAELSRPRRHLGLALLELLRARELGAYSAENAIRLVLEESCQGLSAHQREDLRTAPIEVALPIESLARAREAYCIIFVLDDGTVARGRINERWLQEQ